ncbi:MAG: CPBP family intramembrane glutamic endopeptidase [Candidatus Caldarchaeum sp.]|nr:CPBP family intramembrane glutamic endopeptidase [Candidatus Caldarchaeum sp.]
MSVAKFIGFAFGFAALADVVVYLSGGLTDAFVALVWGLIRMYTPAAAAALSGYKWYRLRRSLGLRLVAFYLLAPLTVFAAVGLYAAFLMASGLYNPSILMASVASPSIPLDPTMVLLLVLLNAYIAAITVNALFAFGEEVGWRGFLQERFEQYGLGFVKASLAVGVVWGLWHASAIILLGYNYPDNRLLGVLLFTAFTTALSLPHAVLKNLSSSVLPASSLHGAVNALWATTC